MSLFFYKTHLALQSLTSWQDLVTVLTLAHCSEIRYLPTICWKFNIHVQISIKSLPCFPVTEAKEETSSKLDSLSLPGIRGRDIESVCCVELDSHQELDFKSLPRTIKAKPKEPVKERGSSKAVIQREAVGVVASGSEAKWPHAHLNQLEPVYTASIFCP